MLISNRDAQRVIVHYEWLLRECPEVREAILRRGWHAATEQKQCELAIKGLIKLQWEGREVF